MNTYLSEKIKIISFLSIIMVVFLHAYNLEYVSQTTALSVKTWNWFIQDFVSFGLTRVAVPIFFLFSGFWFFFNTTGSQDEFRAKIKKRFFTLFIPFLFWSLFGIAFYFAIQSLPQFEKFFSKELVKNYTASMWLNRIFINPIPYQLWFIRDLMVLVVFSPLLYLALKYFGKIWLILCFIGWNCFAPDFHNSSEALLFFSAGGFIAIFHQQILMFDFTKYRIGLPILWIACIAFKTTLIFFAQAAWLVQMALNLSVLVGIVAFWTLQDRLVMQNDNAKTALLKISTLTFFIYACHEPILTIVKKILYLLFGASEMASFAVYLAAPTIAIAIAIILALMMRRFLTPFYQTITGGR